MIHAYNEEYLSQARNTLGKMFDFAVYDLGYKLDEFYNMFPILEEQNDLIITKFVMPKGWKTKKRRSKIDITYDFYNALYGCDLVIFIETRHNQYMHDDICHKIQESIKNGKDVKSELHYIDLVRHIERAGDNVYKIAQTL